VALILQLQAAGLVVVLVLLALHKLLPPAALFPLMAPHHSPQVALLMQQEVQAALQLFCSLEHIWLLLAAVAAVQALQATAVQVVLVAITEPVVAAVAAETAPAALLVALAVQALRAL
jgi:hypothetical protein